jgi:hypothetical protein
VGYVVEGQGPAAREREERDDPGVFDGRVVRGRDVRGCGVCGQVGWIFVGAERVTCMEYGVLEVRTEPVR